MPNCSTIHTFRKSKEKERILGRWQNSRCRESVSSPEQQLHCQNMSNVIWEFGTLFEGLKLPEEDLDNKL